jgi:cysteine desulfuration protein SufE
LIASLCGFICAAMADLSKDIDALIDEFDFLGDWEERYRYLIELGQGLSPLPEAERTDDTKVKGCVSQVWVVLGDDDGKLILRGDSDAHIVKGLVALMSRLYSGRTPHEALSIDPKDVLSRIGLSEHLSPQRSNGLASMIAKVRREAEARAIG